MTRFIKFLIKILIFTRDKSGYFFAKVDFWPKWIFWQKWIFGKSGFFGRSEFICESGFFGQSEFFCEGGFFGKSGFFGQSGVFVNRIFDRSRTRFSIFYQKWSFFQKIERETDKLL